MVLVPVPRQHVGVAFTGQIDLAAYAVAFALQPDTGAAVARAFETVEHMDFLGRYVPQHAAYLILGLTGGAGVAFARAIQLAALFKGQAMAGQVGQTQIADVADAGAQARGGHVGAVGEVDQS